VVVDQEEEAAGARSRGLGHAEQCHSRPGEHKS
jgi:hypothetical protein